MIPIINCRLILSDVGTKTTLTKIQINPLIDRLIVESPALKMYSTK
jgi:hypothetical protein